MLCMYLLPETTTLWQTLMRKGAEGPKNFQKPLYKYKGKFKCSPGGDKNYSTIVGEELYFSFPLEGTQLIVFNTSCWGMSPCQVREIFATQSTVNTLLDLFPNLSQKIIDGFTLVKIVFDLIVHNLQSVFPTFWKKLR